MIYDMANYFKKKNFNKAISYYTKLLNVISKDSIIYSEILYRRGACYERIGKHKESDTDLLNA